MNQSPNTHCSPISHLLAHQSLWSLVLSTQTSFLSEPYVLPSWHTSPVLNLQDAPFCAVVFATLKVGSVSMAFQTVNVL